MTAQSDRHFQQLLGTAALLAFGLLPHGITPNQPLAIRTTLSNNALSRADLERIESGYYERLLDRGGTLDQGPLQQQPKSEGPQFGNRFINDERLTIQVNDIREYVSRPNLKRDLINRIPWTTNTIGMRDLEYKLTKPANTFRIGLAGDSIGMGWGVGDDEGFEPRLEAIFNQRSQSAGGPALEVLNFAVPGHSPGARWHHFASDAWKYQPDLVIFESSPADPGWDERRLRSLLPRNVGFDAPVFEQLLANSAVKPGLTSEAYRAKLKPLKWKLLEAVYRKVAQDCASRAIPCVLILVPRVGRPMEPVDRRRLLDLANLAGFNAVIDGSDAFLGFDFSALTVGSGDYHPNALGHELIAKKLVPLLSLHPSLARLWGRTKDQDLLPVHPFHMTKLGSETQ